LAQERLRPHPVVPPPMTRPLGGQVALPQVAAGSTSHGTAASVDADAQRRMVTRHQSESRRRCKIDIPNVEPLLFELEASCLSPPTYQRRTSLNARYDALDSFTGACMAGERARQRAETEELDSAAASVDLAVDEVHPPALSRQPSLVWQYDALEAGPAFARVAEAGCGGSPSNSSCRRRVALGCFEEDGDGLAAENAVSPSAAGSPRDVTSVPIVALGGPAPEDGDGAM